MVPMVLIQKVAADVDKAGEPMIQKVAAEMVKDGVPMVPIQKFDAEEVKDKVPSAHWTCPSCENWNWGDRTEGRRRRGGQGRRQGAEGADAEGRRGGVDPEGRRWR